MPLECKNRYPVLLDRTRKTMRVGIKVVEPAWFRHVSTGIAVPYSPRSPAPGCARTHPSQTSEPNSESGPPRVLQERWYILRGRKFQNLASLEAISSRPALPSRP